MEVDSQTIIINNHEVDQQASQEDLEVLGEDHLASNQNEQ